MSRADFVFSTKFRRSFSVFARQLFEVCLGIILAAYLMLASLSCSVPLAPGYVVLKESRDLHFVSAPNPELRIRTSYTIENTGTIDLTFVDCTFPNEKTFGRRNLRVQVDGRDAAPGPLPEEYQASAPNALRIALDPLWSRKQKRDLTIEYVLSAPGDSGSGITLGPDSFHLGTRGWLPVLQPPKHFLAPFPKRPAKTIVSIHVPAKFLVLSRGTPAGRKQSGDEIEYRFELRKEDLASFLVAGSYIETSSKGKQSPAALWTLKPLEGDPAPAEERIAAAWRVLEKDFGPLDKNIRVPHMVEAPDLHGSNAGDESPAAASFPGGALVSSETLARGITNDAFFKIVTQTLAHNWFGGEMYSTGDAALGMGEGLPEYAEIVVDEARGGMAARRQHIVEQLHEYDAARKLAVEKPIGQTMMNDPLEQRAIAIAKAPLFYIALEDANGETQVRNGLNRLVTLLRGQEVGYNDLRSALEESTGKNLDDIFRVWLYQVGIPPEFHARYEPANEAQQ